MSDSLGELTLADQRSPEGLSVVGDGTRRVSPPTGARPVRRSGRWGERFEIALLSGPAILVFLAFVILPVGLAAYYGFYRWKGYGAPTDFVGLNNYLLIFQDSA